MAGLGQGGDGLGSRLQGAGVGWDGIGGMVPGIVGLDGVGGDGMGRSGDGMGWDGVRMEWCGDRAALAGIGLAGWLWAGLGSASNRWILTARPLGLGGRKGLVLEFL